MLLTSDDALEPDEVLREHPALVLAETLEVVLCLHRLLHRSDLRQITSDKDYSRLRERTAEQTRRGLWLTEKRVGGRGGGRHVFAVQRKVVPRVAKVVVDLLDDFFVAERLDKRLSKCVRRVGEGDARLCSW